MRMGSLGGGRQGWWGRNSGRRDGYFPKSYVLTKRNILWGIYKWWGTVQIGCRFVRVVFFMSNIPSTPESPPTRAVERIREIIVGRQLERIEQRLEKLEGLGRGSCEVTDETVSRLAAAEQRVEELEQEVRRMGEQLGWEGLRRAEMQEELRRMSGQMRQMAESWGARQMEVQMRQMEERVGAWLGQWQLGVQGHLGARDAALVGQFRMEIAAWSDQMRAELARLGYGVCERQAVEERMRAIAAAARALAECAAAPLAQETSSAS